MPQTTLEEVQRMAAAFGLVAAATVPVSGLTWWARRGGRWQVWRSEWSAVDVIFVAVGYLLLPSLVAVVALGPLPKPGEPENNDLSFRLMTLAPLLAAPVFTLAFFAWARSVEPAAWSWAGFTRHVHTGVVSWVVVTPVVFVVHFASKWLYEQAGGLPDDHPLSKTDPGRDIGRTLQFFAAVCLATPLMEELAFRRALIPWLLTRVRVGIRQFRVCAVVALAGLAAAYRGDWRLGPVVFFCVLVVGLWAVANGRRFRRRFPARTATAVYVTAALFAVVHSSVWPSPVPLFVLGLVLGWLVARTRSVVPAVVCHGLFNAVSTVYLLRGGPG